MILNAFTLFHVVLSLVGIAAGLAVVYGMITRGRVPGAVVLFLTTTVGASVTGFLFPFHQFLPSHALGILSLIVLGIAIYAWRARRLEGIWRRTFVVTSVLALYMNVLVLIVQLFEKTPSLRALAPTQTEPPFQLAQLTALIAFVVFGIMAARGSTARSEKPF